MDTVETLDSVTNSSVQQVGSDGDERKTGNSIIDCDIHYEPVSIVRDLAPRMAPEWRRYLQDGFSGNITPYAHMAGFQRDDIKPEEGHDRASMSMKRLKETHLDVWNIEYGILLGGRILGLAYLPQYGLATALAAAHNDFTVDTWVADGDSRKKASICVAPQDPKAAAREIDRMAEHENMVQVVLTTRSPSGIQWGDEKYYPIWEAAQRNDLPIAFHLLISAGDVTPPMTNGWPRSYMEVQATYPLAAQSELVSIVCRGVFDAFPDLRIVFVENGFEWAPALMWRLDEKWRELRAEVPWLKRTPGDYIRDHVRFTTQPISLPENRAHMVQMIDMMGSEKMIMFSSDWPHWDFDSPAKALPSGLGKDLKQRILSENARDFYRLPAIPGGL